MDSTVKADDPNAIYNRRTRPEGEPVRYGPSPVTQQYNRQGDMSVPPAYWGDRTLRRPEDDNDVDLFQVALQPGGEQEGDPIDQDLFREQQDELNAASVPGPMRRPEQSDSNLVRCVSGRSVRQRPPPDDSPSTACDSSTVSTSTPGGVRLGTAQPPCFGQPPPSISQVPSVPLPPPPPPPPSSSMLSTTAAQQIYPLQWTPLGAMAKTPPEDPLSGSNKQSTGSGGGDPNNLSGSAPSRGAGPGGNPARGGGGVPPRGGPPNGNPSSGNSKSPPS